MQGLGAADTLHAFVSACSTIQTRYALDQFIASDLRQLLPHEYAAYGIGMTTEFRAERCLNVDFPPAYIECLKGQDGVARSPLMRLWIERRAPLYVTVEELRPYASPEWLQAVYEYDVRNFACHGVADFASPFATYFAFGRLHVDETTIKNLLSLITPHLHMALLNVLASEARAPIDRQGQRLSARTSGGAQGMQRLSMREVEVLEWLYYGKTNSEIALILDTSVHTIKNHVQNILIKLGASNRTDAVSRALRKGLIVIDGAPREAGVALPLSVVERDSA